MDWPLSDPEFFEEDLDSVFLYEPRRSKGVYRFEGDKDITERWLETDEDVLRWIEEINARRSTPGLAVILGARAEQPNDKHNPAILEYLPFSRASFERITKAFPLHGETVRVINRSDVAFFTDINLLDRPCNALFHILRTCASYPGDLALTSSSHPCITTTTTTTTTTTPGNTPPSFHTTALLLGLTPSQTTSLTNRLANAPSSTLTHPLILPGILVELEHDRHMGLVKQRVAHLLQRVRQVSRGPAGGGAISATGRLRGDEYGVDLWIEVWQLRTALQGWLGEVRKVETAGRCCRCYRCCCCEGEEGERKGTGGRIGKRLREICDEYEGKVRECGMVIHGMELSAQLSWNQIGYQDTQTNLKIASDTRQDSNQMRSIAFLTMFFLPATFLATLFSTTFFNWNPKAGEHVVSPYLWIYTVITISITAFIVGCWFYFTRRRPSSSGYDTDEKLSV